MLVALTGVASAKHPPSFCHFSPGLCHPVVGERRAHYLGFLQQVTRAVPKVPGYRCAVESTEVDDVGFGTSAQRAAPMRIFASVWCFQALTDQRTRRPDVTIDVELSTLPAMAEPDPMRDKDHDLVTYTAPHAFYFVFGKLYVCEALPGVIVGCGCDPERGVCPQREVVNDGPYLLSAKIRIFTDDAAALDNFWRGFDRAAVSTMMAREARLRAADPESKPIWHVLPEPPAPPAR